MWYRAAVFFAATLVAVVFNFGSGDTTASAAGAAKVVFYLCLVLAAVSLFPNRRPST